MSRSYSRAAASGEADPVERRAGLRVEPVAWVSARGTVLGGLLLVLSTLAYVTGWERGHLARTQ